MNKITRLRLEKILFVILRPFFWKAVLKGTFPSLEHYSVLKLLNSRKISFIFDVGANKGQFSLISSYLFPKFYQES